MKKKIIALCICIFLFSCDKKVSNEFPEILFDELQYKLNLPDTVIVNKPYQATIEFKSDFDKIIPPLQAGGEALNDSTRSRLIYFYHYEPTSSSIKSISQLVLIDSTFVLNKSFDVNNIVFKEKGEFIFNGLIKDELMHSHYNEEGILDGVRFDRLKQQISKKVVVIDKK